MPRMEYEDVMGDLGNGIDEMFRQKSFEQVDVACDLANMRIARSREMLSVLEG